MYTYKTEPKTVTKDEVLFQNGITTVDVDEGRFLQYNDYFEHKTFFQCPRCKSLNVDRDRAFGSNTLVVIVRSCEDCGYKYTTGLTKEDE